MHGLVYCVGGGPARRCRRRCPCAVRDSADKQRLGADLTVLLPQEHSWLPLQLRAAATSRTSSLARGSVCTAHARLQLSRVRAQVAEVRDRARPGSAEGRQAAADKPLPDEDVLDGSLRGHDQAAGQRPYHLHRTWERINADIKAWSKLTNHQRHAPVEQACHRPVKAQTILRIPPAGCPRPLACLSGS